jgi:hypothetical protein
LIVNTRLSINPASAAGLLDDAILAAARDERRARRRVDQMASNWRVRGPAVPELAAAGVVLILGAVGAARLAVTPPAGLPMSLTTWSVLMLLLAIMLAAR